MNRAFLVSIVGLSALSAAGFAGSQGTNAALVTFTSTSRQEPVVLVTRPDGECVVARCVSVAASDPISPGQRGPSTFTFTTQAGGGPGSNSLVARGTGAATGVGVNALAPLSGAVSSSNGSGEGSRFSSFSSTAASPSIAQGGAAFARKPDTQPSSCSAPCEEPASVTVTSEPNSLFARIYSTQGQAPIAIEYSDAVRGMVSAKSVDADFESVGEEVERVLEVAREHLSVNQDGAREAWQRAAEEAREAQERAREAYADAMENYREAMRADEERMRNAAERATIERRAQADRKSWSQRSNARGSEAGDRDAGLASRIDKLEAAARARGVDVADDERSLEERVAQLEKLMTEEKGLRSNGLFPRMPSAAAPTAPRAFRLRRSNALAPMPPVAPVPPVEAEQPAQDASPFWLGAAPMAPTPPSASTPRSTQANERERMSKAMDDLKRDAARLREELTRMRAQIELLPREPDTR
ncbi:MAG: hypothetical protein SGI72_17630 [Planctomycetota bacterium]|nr:hypothetical protein [Planctomycetota bacterium]